MSTASSRNPATPRLYQKRVTSSIAFTCGVSYEALNNVAKYATATRAAIIERLLKAGADANTVSGANKTAAKSTARKTIKTKDRKTKARALPAAKPRPRPKQRIAISHHREEDFKADGLRTYAQYRDLGIAEASHGLAQFEPATARAVAIIERRDEQLGALSAFRIRRDVGVEPPARLDRALRRVVDGVVDQDALEIARHLETLHKEPFARASRPLSGRAARHKSGFLINQKRELTSLTVLRYSSGHRKGRLKILSIIHRGVGTRAQSAGADQQAEHKDQPANHPQVRIRRDVHSASPTLMFRGRLRSSAPPRSTGSRAGRRAAAGTGPDGRVGRANGRHRTKRC